MDVLGTGDQGSVALLLGTQDVSKTIHSRSFQGRQRWDWTLGGVLESVKILVAPRRFR